MIRLLSRAAVSVIFMLLIQAVAVLPSLAAGSEKNPPGAVDGARVTGPGRLMGVVTDGAGAALESILVSATGPAGVSLAVCDAEGRFELRGLRPGTYLLRAHLAGFSTARRHEVEVRSGLPSVEALTLRRADKIQPAFLAAGVGDFSNSVGAGLVVQPAEVAGDANDDPFAIELDDSEAGVAPHDDSQKAWRIRRARRSVLKDSGVTRVGQDRGDPVVGFTARVAADRNAMRNPGSGFPISGQLHLLTRTRIQSSSELWSTDILPGQIAYISLGGPDQQSHWGLRGAVRTGDAGSWVLAGTYNTKTDGHAVSVGLSYSRQDIDARSTQLSPTPSASAPEDAANERGGGGGGREVGGLSVQGTWKASRHVTIDYGANVAHYGYLPEDGLFSPNAVVTLAPMSRTRVRVAVAQSMLAPGAEEFLPPAEGVWLPPERTFAVLSSTNPLSAERARHVEFVLERDVGGASTIGIRRFYQGVDDQMVALFGVRPQLAASPDHYYLTSASGVSAEGWGLVFTHALAGRVRGSVDYSLTNAEWAPWSVSGLSPQTIGAFRTGTERFHDVTTWVETKIPETATDVFVLYRVNTAYSVTDPQTRSLVPGLGGRFALRVKQTLPFSPIEGSDWQVLVDIRNIFREQTIGASVYDELLVANPPKQVIGGLVVNF